MRRTSSSGSYWSARRTCPHRVQDAGYTENQRQQVAVDRERLLELGVQVSTHPFWKFVEPGLVVAARIHLKHVDDEPPVDKAA